MSLWLDLLGVEIKYVETKNFGRIRIAEAGKEHPETIIFQHGINGHLEAYSKNLNQLAKEFHVIAFDYVGHGLSTKKELTYTPMMLAEQLKELMDALNIEKAHLSGESLGGWVSGIFAGKYPERTLRVMLNTAGGIPIVSQKGRQDLENLISLNKRNSNNTPTYETVQARMHWLMHEKNKHLVDDELVALRLGIYLQPESKNVLAKINNIIENHDDYLIPLKEIKADTLFLWTKDNPIHDIEAVTAAQKEVQESEIYIMKGDAAHWPQYEEPEEFNQVAINFFKTGKTA